MPIPSNSGRYVGRLTKTPSLSTDEQFPFLLMAQSSLLYPSFFPNCVSFFSHLLHSCPIGVGVFPWEKKCVLDGMCACLIRKPCSDPCVQRDAIGPNGSLAVTRQLCLSLISLSVLLCRIFTKDGVIEQTDRVRKGGEMDRGVNGFSLPPSPPHPHFF